MIKENLDSLQNEKLNLQVELNLLLHESNPNQDKINELKSDILYLDKKIEKIVGKKEIERQNELKRKKVGIDEINKNNYYNLKYKVNKISPMMVATNRIISVLENISKETINEERVRVKI